MILSVEETLFKCTKKTSLKKQLPPVLTVNRHNETIRLLEDLRTKSELIVSGSLVKKKLIRSFITASKPSEI